MKKKILLGLLLFVGVTLNSQQISELEKQLKSTSGKEKYELLYKISKAYLPISARKSLSYGNQALDLAKRLNSKNKEANALNLIGTAYYKHEKYRDAVKTYEKEYKIRKNLNQIAGSTKTLYNIGSIYKVWGKESRALEAYKKVLSASKKQKNSTMVAQCYESIIEIYSSDRKYKDAFEYMADYMAYLNASKITSERRKIAILETQYAEEKKQKEETEQQLALVDSNLHAVKEQKENLVRDTAEKSLEIADLTIETHEQEVTIHEQQEENEWQRQLLIAFISFFVVILLFSIVLYFQVRAKNKANNLLLIKNEEIRGQKEEIQGQAEQLLERNAQIEESKEEIQAQAEQLEHANRELTRQKDEIQYQNDQITDSIQYASRIQKVMLPQQELMDGLMPNNMVFFKPRDIVSGDFYWCKQIKNFVIFAAADCTGHGVPGAFMSMLGISFLNEIVSKSRFDKPNEILNTLRKRIKKSLNQTGESFESADGMDMALCVLDTEYNIMQFAGAYNSLYLIRDGELQVYKADRQPVAIYMREKDFTNYEFEVKKDDCIYLFSDGYKDQFGGDRGHKYKSKRFNELLLSIHKKPMKEQRAILDKTITDWMGSNHEQLDDILVLGVKI